MLKKKGSKESLLLSTKETDVPSMNTVGVGYSTAVGHAMSSLTIQQKEQYSSPVNLLLAS